MIVVNGTGEDRGFTLPEQGQGMSWNLFLDTAADPPNDAWPKLDGPSFPASRRIVMMSHSMRVYVSEIVKWPV
jgi:glycogen operon protein